MEVFVVTSEYIFTSIRIHILFRKSEEPRKSMDQFILKAVLSCGLVAYYTLACWLLMKKVITHVESGIAKSFS